MQSQPIVNLTVDAKAFRDYAKACHDYAELVRIVHFSFKKEKYVEGHKRSLGRQDFCFNGSYRYWVWNDANMRWRIFVSNQRGISLEVNQETVHTMQEGVDCYREYAKLIGAI